jgi:hypothetical protein
MVRFRGSFAGIALAITLASVVGCGHMTTAPVVEGPAAAVSAGTSTAPAPTAMGANGATTDGLLSGVGPLVDSFVGLIVRVLNLAGGHGGSLTNGRWRVDVPANAVEGNATVQLGVPNARSVGCQLGIIPATKNHFDRPVLLTADCRSVPSDQLSNYVILWFNPDTRTWVPVAGSRVDLVHKTVSAPLQHFSRYAVGPADGKAGW